MPGEAPSEAREIRDALRRLAVAHGVLDVNHRPCGAPISTPHAWTLLELRGGATMTTSALAARLNIDRTNVSRLCTRMVSLGELAREPHPDDGRAWLVRLTPKGERVAANVDRSSAEHFARVLEGVDVPYDRLLAALESLTAALVDPQRPPKENPPCPPTP